MRFTTRQRLVVRMLSLSPGGTSMAYLVYVLGSKYPKQVNGEVRVWRPTFESLRRKKLLLRRWDHTHWSWSLTRPGYEKACEWLCQERRKSLEITRR